MSRVAAIIQARLNSTRLPGKVLLPLGQKSMLYNIATRVKRSKRLDDVIIAIPSSDWTALGLNLVFAECGLLGPPCDENDLISRFFIIAKWRQADYVIRVAADNPFIDPAAIDMLIDYAMQKQPRAILYTNAGDLKGSQWPNGIGAEFYTMKMLEWMHETVHRADLREHPHKYWHTLGYAEEPPCPSLWSRPDIRLDINTREDYEFVQKIYDHFGNNEFTTEDVISYVDELHGWDKKIFTDAMKLKEKMA